MTVQTGPDRGILLRSGPKIRDRTAYKSVRFGPVSLVTPEPAAISSYQLLIWFTPCTIITGGITVPSAIIDSTSVTERRFSGDAIYKGYLILDKSIIICINSYINNITRYNYILSTCYSNLKPSFIEINDIPSLDSM